MAPHANSDDEAELTEFGFTDEDPGELRERILEHSRDKIGP